MEVEYLSQACVLLRAPGATVLTDPWFSGRAHLGGWSPYPNWRDADLRDLRARCDAATHVYVSHDHEDHFDPAFLRALAPGKTLLVGAFRNARFRAALEALAPRHALRFLAHGEPLALAPDVRASVYLEQPAFRTNSVLLLETPDGAVLDANDCGVDRTTMRAIARRTPVALALYTLNFMANGYPFPYLRERDADREARVREVRDGVLSGFRAMIDALKPSMAAAIAGPVVLVDPENDYLNEHPEARDWRAVVAESDGAVPVRWPAPGAVFTVRERRVTEAALGSWPAVWERFPWREGRDVAPDDAFLTAPPGAATSAPALEPAARSLAARLRACADDARVAPPSTRLALTPVRSLAQAEADDAAEHVLVTLDGEAPRVAVHAGPLAAPYLQVLALGPTLEGFCRGDVGLDALLLSGRARFRREPDAFDGLLHNLLRFSADEGTRAALVAWLGAEREGRGATLTVEANGRRYEIPRVCPHEGEPLDGVAPLDGTIRCPRHRWVFDLETGRCSVGDKRCNLYGAKPPAPRQP